MLGMERETWGWVIDLWKVFLDVHDWGQNLQERLILVYEANLDILESYQG
jgi:hypothetical protein